MANRRLYTKEMIDDLFIDFKWNYSQYQCDLLVTGYCRTSYIEIYCNIELYTFPQLIIDLVVQCVCTSRETAKSSTVRLTKRIQKEMYKWNSIPGIDIIRHVTNYRYCLVKIPGPVDTPYEEGIFWMELFLTKEYPMKPPKARMLTPIYHPNIDKLGRICLDILKDKWTPALSISRICLSIQLLLQDPSPDDPLDSSGSDRWSSWKIDLNLAEYLKITRSVLLK